MADKAKAKGKKIGRNSKKASTQRSKDRFNRCQDSKAQRIISLILNGNNKTKSKVQPKLIDRQDGTHKIVGFPGYIYIAHNKSIVRGNSNKKG